MEEQLKLKMKELRESSTQRYRKIVLGICCALFPLAMIFISITVIQSSGWNKIPQTFLTMVAFFAIGGFIVYKLVTKEYRCLNYKHYNFCEAVVTEKKFVDESLEFVGVENQMRKFEKQYYLLLNNEEYFTLTKSWVYREIEEGKKYFLAMTGRKRKKSSMIICAVEVK